MRIVLRTEGNHAQGMGDLWGSIALADEFAKYSDEILFMISGGEEATALITERRYRFQTVDSFGQEQEILKSFCPDVIIINKLNNSPAYVKFLKSFGCLIVVFDDNGEGSMCADLRINVLYHVPDSVTDTRYIALRSEFQKLNSKVKVIKNEVKELLITQGGSDTFGFTPKILRALEKANSRPHCTVVLGPAFRHNAELQTVRATSTLNLTIIDNARNISELMANADLAITAGGLTMFELACIGTPSLVICGERFEVETAARFELAGAGINLGFGGDLDDHKLSRTVDFVAQNVSLRKRMSRCAQRLVDGRGSERVVTLIRETVLSKSNCLL